MFSIKFWLLWFFWWNCICVLIFLRTFLSSLHFCEVSSVYYSFNPFSVQFYCFPPMDFFSCHCPCSVFISSKAKHESLLSEFFQIWWNKLTCFCLEVLYCVFPFLAYLSQILLVWPCVYRQGLSMQKLVKNLIAFNELISAAFQTAFGFAKCSRDVISYCKSMTKTSVDLFNAEFFLWLLNLRKTRGLLLLHECQPYVSKSQV